MAEQVRVETRLEAELNQRGIVTCNWEPEMSLTDGVKETVRVAAAPLTAEEEVWVQLSREEAMYGRVIDALSMAVPPL